MKLTNTIRDAFIRAAMDDVPSVDYTESIRKLVHEDAIAALPPSVAKLYKDSKTVEYVNTYYGYYNGTSVTFPMSKHSSYKPSSVCSASLAEIKTTKDAQETLRKELHTKLKAAAYSVTTRARLVDLLPTFEKYLPADEASAVIKNLPSIANIHRDFVNAGWPKNKKPVVKQVTI